MTQNNTKGIQDQNQATYENTAEARRITIVDSSGNTNDGDSPIFIHNSGEVSTINSSTSILTSGSVFTGVGEDIKNESVIIVTVFSDVASATDGLAVEWSPDNVNWDGSDVFTIAANTQKTFSFQPVTRYFRVKYTNGGTNQAVFRLQTSLKTSYVKPSSHRIDDAISGEDDAELVKSIVTGKNPGGAFVNFQATTAGNFKMSVEEFDVAFLANPLPVVKGFNIPIYDYIALTYVAAGNGVGEIETVIYKTGGSGGSTVATLTLAYNANNEIASVTQS